MEMGVLPAPFFEFHCRSLMIHAFWYIKTKKIKINRTFEKLPLPYFIWKSINQPLKSPKYGWFIDFQLKYGRCNFSKVLFSFIFLVFIYQNACIIKLLRWNSKKGADRTPISILRNYGQICIFDRNFRKLNWPKILNRSR